MSHGQPHTRPHQTIRSARPSCCRKGGILAVAVTPTWPYTRPVCAAADADRRVGGPWPRTRQGPVLPSWNAGTLVVLTALPHNVPHTQTPHDEAAAVAGGCGIRVRTVTLSRPSVTTDAGHTKKGARGRWLGPGARLTPPVGGPRCPRLAHQRAASAGWGHRLPRLGQPHTRTPTHTGTSRAASPMRQRC